MEKTNSSSIEGRGKRGLEGCDDDEEHQQPVRNRPALSSVIYDAGMVDFSSLGPLIRRVANEAANEVADRILAELGRARLIGRYSPQRNRGLDGRNLQLHFKCRLSLPLFTGGNVQGKKGAAIHVELKDANTGHVVTSGPESSVKLDVVVLAGDFNNEDEGWSRKEFESHVVKERDGKRPLLTGDLQVTLKEGVGTLRDLTFTDNSSWIRSKKFRLGLKVSSGYCESVRIREAKTEAFIVKDHRGKLYEKHYPPTLIDEVWRLEKISKDGSFHKKLNNAEIYTVEHFLRLVVRDSQELKRILGSGMSYKMWDVLIKHARTCVLSEKLYVYYPDDSRYVGVVFNNIYELSGLVYNDEYFQEDSLSDSQKVDVDNWVKKAYDNWKQIVEYDVKTPSNFKQTEKSSTSQRPLVPVNYPHTSDNQLPPSRLQVSVLFGSSSMDQSMVIGGSGDNDNMTRLINSNTCSQFERASFTQQVDLTNQSASTSHGNGVGFALNPSHSSPFDSSLQQASINPFEDMSNKLDRSMEGFLSEEDDHHQIFWDDEIFAGFKEFVPYFNLLSNGNPSVTDYNRNWF